MQNRRGIAHFLVFLLLLYSLWHFAQAGRAVAAMEQTAAHLEEEIRGLEQEHAELEQRLKQKDSPDEMEALARRELGMVMPGEIVFTFAQAEESNLEETERDPVWPWK